MHATRRLRDEHRLILRVLDCLELELGRAEGGGAVSRRSYEPFVEFIRAFADDCHHRKEEDCLFPGLASRGIDLEGSPVAQVVDEHDAGRELAAAITRELGPAERGDGEARRRLVGAGRALVDLLRRHIDKEEHCVFGLAEAALGGNELARLLEAYAALEADPVYRKNWERGRELSDALARRYGLAPAPLASDARPRAIVRSPRARTPFAAEPAWRAWASPLPLDAGTELGDRIERVLGSRAVSVQRVALERVGRRIDPEPILWKILPSGHLRAFFPVRGEPDHVDAGSVVAVVLLHELAHEHTLYAHPVYAGPEANPLLKHLAGPMSRPRAQEGENGVRATLRLLLHKAALWERFEEERATLGIEAASRLWRERYGWALVRLYFCERCPGCRWGDPACAGAGRVGIETPASAPPPTGARMPGWERIAGAVRASEAFRIEVDYARRGAFHIGEEPRLVASLGDGGWLTVFPSDAAWLEGGSIVALAAYHHEPSGETRYAHCLSFGPEAETLFLRGDRALGLALPGGVDGDTRRSEYRAWRARAWSAFWLDELEQGPHAASRRWLAGLWTALDRLLGAGCDRGPAPVPPLPSAGADGALSA